MAPADKHYSVVIGAVNGKFTDTFARLAVLHSKQNFAFGIIAGDLFANLETATDGDKKDLARLLRGDITMPFSTYFALGRRSLPDEVVEILEKSQGELCPNLSILGRKVSIKTSESFRIVAVGGVHSTRADQPMSEYTAEFTDGDAQAVGNGLADADILVTSEWPSHIQHGGKAYTGASPSGVDSIANLCTALKPRYHFSASEAFYEREPFFHNGPSPRSVTRFISLAPSGNAAKHKAMYAFTLEPSSAAPQDLPAGCTASPLTSVTAMNKKRKLESQEDDYNSYRFANGNGADHYRPDHGRGGKRRYNRPAPTPDQCYFCLSKPECEQHLIASLGTNAYLTVAKGPLTLHDTYPELGFPGHVLIIPYEHTPTMSAIRDMGSRQTTVKEMQRYRGALQDMLVAKTKGEDGLAKLGAVTWEISRNSGVHLHWQFLPVSVNLIRKGLVEAAFSVEAENTNYPKFETGLKEMEDMEEGNYFKVTIWSEALRKEMVMPLDGDFRIDLQFGRRVLGKLLDLQQRTYWKDCGQTVAEETSDTTAFKAAFEEFDFSLEE
ncbi:hypothetical protein LTR53_008470 [Teratosphaeriaceae sp. CCFEE 6253]|nr:hypothetical protein LTR53_008470 [Teratosphaeriaceae sp. CCFEE 6253]